MFRSCFFFSLSLSLSPSLRLSLHTHTSICIYIYIHKQESRLWANSYPCIDSLPPSVGTLSTAYQQCSWLPHARSLAPSAAMTSLSTACTSVKPLQVWLNVAPRHIGSAYMQKYLHKHADTRCICIYIYTHTYHPTIDQSIYLF